MDLRERHRTGGPHEHAERRVAEVLPPQAKSTRGRRWDRGRPAERRPTEAPPRAFGRTRPENLTEDSELAVEPSHRFGIAALVLVESRLRLDQFLATPDELGAFGHAGRAQTTPIDVEGTCHVGAP